MIHWTKIKKAVEEAGGTWTERIAGEAFLAEKGVVLEEDAPASDVMFDPSKPHGIISGEVDNAPAARYFQNGHYFNGQGKKVG